jgi:hypothetical protein
MGLESTSLVFVQVKTVPALDRAATVFDLVKCTAKIKIDNISLTLSENRQNDKIYNGYKIIIRFGFDEAIPAGISLVIM